MAQTMFPVISRSYIESFQFSFWNKQFSNVSPKTVVIRPLSDLFRSYLEADGVIIPEGSEDIAASSTLSDDESSEDDDSKTERYSFPQLDEQIREAVKHYGAVFPKLNWTSPKDAEWVLPTLKCTTPADVYLLLKSSDFISHDLDPSLAFEGCHEDVSTNNASPSTSHPTLHALELVLKKWYPIDRGREFRCFVRNEVLLAISQRDPNYYPSLNELATKNCILLSITKFWFHHIRGKFPGGSNYIFDIYLTKDLSSGHILDFNPYHQKTDPLLFTYDDLHQLLVSATVSMTSATTERPVKPLAILRTIDSHSHPSMARSAPTNQHNSVPFDALQLSTGVDIATFARLWEDRLKENLDVESDDEPRVKTH